MLWLMMALAFGQDAGALSCPRATALPWGVLPREVVDALEPDAPLLFVVHHQRVAGLRVTPVPDARAELLAAPGARQDGAAVALGDLSAADALPTLGGAVDVCLWRTQRTTTALLESNEFVSWTRDDRPPEGTRAWVGPNMLEAARNPREAPRRQAPRSVVEPYTLYVLNGENPEGVGALHASRSPMSMAWMPTDDPDALVASFPEQEFVDVQIRPDGVLRGSRFWMDQMNHRFATPWWHDPITTPGVVALWGEEYEHRVVTTETDGLRRVAATNVSLERIGSLRPLRGLSGLVPWDLKQPRRRPTPPPAPAEPTLSLHWLDVTWRSPVKAVVPPAGSPSPSAAWSCSPTASTVGWRTPTCPRARCRCAMQCRRGAARPPSSRWTTRGAPSSACGCA